MPEQDLLGILRAQAWERAKGELRAMLAAFISRGDPALRKRFDALDGTVQKFINEVEENGLQE